MNHYRVTTYELVRIVDGKREPLPCSSHNTEKFGFFDFMAEAQKYLKKHKIPPAEAEVVVQTTEITRISMDGPGDLKSSVFS